MFVLTYCYQNGMIIGDSPLGGIKNACQLSTTLPFHAESQLKKTEYFSAEKNKKNFAKSWPNSKKI